MKTEQQFENTREALRMWATVPPENVTPELAIFRIEGGFKPPTCRTIACFGAWLPYWPAFSAMGVFADPLSGCPLMAGVFFPATASAVLFGDSDAITRRGWHRADANFQGTDHELVTHRLNCMLNTRELS